MGPTGSPLASLSHLRDAMAGSSIPLGVVDLSDGTLAFVNDSAAALFGRAASELIGRPATSLWDETSREQADRALGALAAGALDSYRGCRRIRTPSGVVEVWLWTRTVTLTQGDVAVSVLAPVGASDASGRLIGTYFGPDSIEVAVGTVDRDSRRLADIRPKSQVVLNLTPTAASGADLMSLVHPDDVVRLLDVLGGSDPESDRSATIRVMDSNLAWTEVHCAALPTPSDEPQRVAFAPAVRTRADDSPSGRLAELERQMLQIAAELHSVSDRRRSEPAVENHRPALDALQPKQREIVDRLLKGERVSTIAEAMFLSPSTVRNHLSKVFKTFGANSQASLLSVLRAELGPDEQDPTAASAGPRDRHGLHGPPGRSEWPASKRGSSLHRWQ